MAQPRQHVSHPRPFGLNPGQTCRPQPILQSARDVAPKADVEDATGIEEEEAMIPLPTRSEEDAAAVVPVDAR